MSNRKSKPKINGVPVYGYGIVDRNGNPYWDESCVCQDRGPMEEVVENLNDTRFDVCFNEVLDSRAPYRVVRLLYQEVDHDSR